MDEWFYCPPNGNHANVIIRLERFDLTNNLWWYGPTFLQTKDLPEESTVFLLQVIARRTNIYIPRKHSTTSLSSTHSRL